MDKKNGLNLHTTIHSIRRISDLLTEFIIHSPKLIKTIDIGEFVKFQNYLKKGFYLAEPVALTPVYLDYENDLVHFIIKERGASTRIMSRLEVGERVVAMGAIGEKLPMEVFEKKTILVVCQGFTHYFNLFLMEKIFDTVQSAEITLLSDDLDKIDGFYRFRLQKYSHRIIDCKGNKARLQDLIVNRAKEFSCIILGLKDDNLKEQIYCLDTLIIDLRNAVMQCMLDGVCGRCVQSNSSGEYFFACGKSRYVIRNKNCPRITERLCQNSLLEKIAYLKSKILIPN